MSKVRKQRLVILLTYKIYKDTIKLNKAKCYTIQLDNNSLNEATLHRVCSKSVWYFTL